MNPNLAELAQFIRGVVPQPREVHNLSADEAAHVVRFHWQGHDFVVRPGLDVYEERNSKIFITAGSALMQLVLRKKNRNMDVVDTAMGMLKEAEDFIRADSVPKGLSLLNAAREALGKLVKLAPAPAKCP